MQHQRIIAANVGSRASFRYALLPDDLEPVMALYRRFYGEAVYKDFIEWDDERAAATIEYGIKHHTRPHVLAVVEDEIVGFVCWQLDHSFSKAPVAVLYELYVAPERRRSAIGRFLVHLMCWVAKDDGACAIHAPVASGMDAAKSLFNLFTKAGFEQLGYVMRKKL